MLELRPWSLDDINQIAIFANNKKIAENLRDVFPNPYTVLDAEHFIKYCIESGDAKEINRVITVDNIPVGSISITKGDDIFSKSAELGYWLAEEYWGKGIVTEAVKTMCLLTFEMSDIIRIFALPFSYNKGSCKVLEKCGFVQEGLLKKAVFKNGQFTDCFVYALLKGNV